MMDISFVIPCYCSEKNLQFVVDEIREAMKKKPSFEYEIILVNDNSKDNTKQLIEKLVAADSRIVGINFSKNFGQPSGLLAGFRMAKGKYIMTSDDDGQTPVGMVWDFYDKIQEGYDVVCAKYKETTQKSRIRRLGTELNEFMMYHMLDKPKSLRLSSFFMAKKFVVKEVIKYQNAYPYIAGLLLRTTSKIANIEISQRERREGNSGYTFQKLVKLWLNGFTAFSVKPLRIGSALGFGSSIIGFFVAIIALVRKLMIPTIQVGYTSQIAVQLIIGGLILGVLGIIGEYIGRIYMCINKKPQYVIESIVGKEEEYEKNS